MVQSLIKHLPGKFLWKKEHDVRDGEERDFGPLFSGAQYLEDEDIEDVSHSFEEEAGSNVVHPDYNDEVGASLQMDFIDLLEEIDDALPEEQFPHEDKVRLIQHFRKSLKQLSPLRVVELLKSLRGLAPAVARTTLMVGLGVGSVLDEAKAAGNYNFGEAHYRSYGQYFVRALYFGSELGQVEVPTVLNQNQELEKGILVRKDGAESLKQFCLKNGYFREQAGYTYVDWLSDLVAFNANIAQSGEFQEFHLETLVEYLTGGNRSEVEDTYMVIPVSLNANHQSPEAFAASHRARIAETLERMPQQDYIIQRGDNLGKIAAIFGTTVDMLQKLNGMEPGDTTIIAGKKLRVPAKVFAKITEPDTAPKAEDLPKGEVPEARLGEMTTAQKSHFGSLVYQNECSRNSEKLAYWSDKEAFPSLGIGHFIWKDEDGQDKTPFPEFLRVCRDVHNYDLPQWLDDALESGVRPWPNRAAFYAADEQRKWLIQFLSSPQCMAWQADAIIDRFEEGGESIIMSVIPKAEKAAVQKKIAALKAHPNGQYAIMDFTSFKGEGNTAKALRRMKSGLTGIEAVRSFAEGCKSALSERPDIEKWRNGWWNRIDTYTSNINISDSAVAQSVPEGERNAAQRYTVRGGDTLWSIARAHETTVAHLKDVNNLTSDDIHEGDILLLSTLDKQLVEQPPEATKEVRHVVKSGETLSAIARKYKVDVQILIKQNGGTDIFPGDVLAIYSDVTPEPESSQESEAKIDSREDAIAWRELWRQNNITLTSTYAEQNAVTEDGLTNASRRTCLLGARDTTMRGFLTLVQGADLNQAVQVNGVAESYGHAPGKTPQSLSHKNGFKIDFRTDRVGGQALKAFIESKDKSPRKVSGLGSIYEFTYQGYKYKVIMGGTHANHADVAVISGPSNANLAQN